MDHDEAVSALAALAQTHRLALFRRLVTAGAPGMTAGALADAAGVSPTGLSFHMKELERAGLVTQSREGRFIRYALAVDEMRALMTFLSEDCCGGRPELCGDLPIPAGEAQSVTCCTPSRRAPAKALPRPKTSGKSRSA